MSTPISINPGLFRHRITIQKKNPGIDSDGIPQDNWTDYAHAYAMVEGINGTRYFNAEASTVLASVLFHIRYQRNIQIDTSMRVVYSGKNYNIKDVIDTDGKHIEWQLPCSEEIQNG